MNFNHESNEAGPPALFMCCRSSVTINRMQDGHSPENDGDKNTGSFQFSLRRLFFWVTVSALAMALFANEQFELLLLILVTVFALCGTNLLVGRRPSNPLLWVPWAIVFAAIWILIPLAMALIFSASQ